MLLIQVTPWASLYALLFPPHPLKIHWTCAIYQTVGYVANLDSGLCCKFRQCRLRASCFLENLNAAQAIRASAPFGGVVSKGYYVIMRLGTSNTEHLDRAVSTKTRHGIQPSTPNVSQQCNVVEKAMVILHT